MAGAGPGASWPWFDIPNPPAADGTTLHEQDGWRYYADSASSTGVSCEMVVGGAPDVEKTVRERAETALDFLQPRIRDWATLTNAQKDQAMLVVAKSTAGLLRVLLRRFEETGDA